MCAQHVCASACARLTRCALHQVAELARKLVLTSLVIFFDAGSALQVAFALLVSGWAHVAHAAYKPFAHNNVAAYYLQHASLGITTFLFCNGLLFKVNGFAVDDGTARLVDTQKVVDALGILLVVLCVLFLAAAGVLGVTEFSANVNIAISSARRQRIAHRKYAMLRFSSRRGVNLRSPDIELAAVDQSLATGDTAKRKQSRVAAMVGAVVRSTGKPELPASGPFTSNPLFAHGGSNGSGSQARGGRAARGRGRGRGRPLATRVTATAGAAGGDVADSQDA